MQRAILTAIAVGNGARARGAPDAADVQQRNVDQQQRIEQGLASGQLKTEEAARLERRRGRRSICWRRRLGHGQARVNRVEANAAANGRVGVAEQGRIQSLENRQGRRILRKECNLRETEPR